MYSWNSLHNKPDILGWYRLYIAYLSTNHWFLQCDNCGVEQCNTRPSHTITPSHIGLFLVQFLSDPQHISMHEVLYNPPKQFVIHYLHVVMLERHFLVLCAKDAYSTRIKYTSFKSCVPNIPASGFILASVPSRGHVMWSNTASLVESRVRVHRCSHSHFKLSPRVWLSFFMKWFTH